MKKSWFKRFGWVYLPTAVMGYITTFFAIIFMIPVVIAADRNAHSISDEMYTIFIYFTCTAFWWKWIAEKTSK